MPTSPEQTAERHPFDSQRASNPEEKQEEWVTVKEAAEISGYNPDTIYQIIHRGRVPVQRREVMVERIYVSVNALMEYKKSRPSPAERGRIGGRIGGRGRPRKKAEAW